MHLQKLYRSPPFPFPLTPSGRPVASTPSRSKPVPCEMESSGQWEDVKARSEALRRRVVAEEEAPERSPGKAVDRPGAQDPIEDEDDTWDPFCPMEIDDALRARMAEKPTAEPNLRKAKEKDLAWQKHIAEEAKFYEQTWPDSDPDDISSYGFRKDSNALWSRHYGPFEAISKFSSNLGPFEAII